MLNNYFTKEETYDILDNSNKKIGVNVVTYRVLKIRNTKNLTSSNTYSVIVKHRISVQGSEWKPGGTYQLDGFSNYPIMLGVQSGIIEISNPKAEIVLKRIFPKTINASVEQSSNQSTGTSKTQTHQTSSGSSTSNVNTFGVDLSVGWFDGLTGSISLDYSHSWEHSHSQSASVGRSSSSNAQAASGNEMSVKDWSAYSSIQNFDQSSQNYQGEFIQWDWGQTYPWNIFEYNEVGTGSTILLPEDVVARLLYYGSTNIDSKNILLPPSDLSLFGIDFTMAAEWHVTFPDKITSIESLKFQHEVDVRHGSHFMTPPSGNGPASLTASLTSGSSNIMTQAKQMDVGQYALMPLLENRRIGKGIGFQKNLFDIPPSNSESIFKIRSRGNDLLVTGQGFDSVMSAAFNRGYSGSGATMNIAFKIADERTEYALILKHWKGPESGNIVLNCNINGYKTTINVVDLEGQGSSNNLDLLELRNFDLKSINFHNYLVLGWNEVTITIFPSDPSVSSEYIISALSVEG